MTKKPSKSRPNPTPKRKQRVTKLEREAFEELIQRLLGCCKGADSLVDALHEGRREKSSIERRLEEPS